jgi:cytochrome d ubiquinol oxidase subunit I
MDDLLAARLQMASSLGFHIVFACIGMAMPWLMVLAQWRWMRTGDAVYLRLSKAWAQGVGVFFAVGAVSGTILSFELGLLWPGFMEHAGPIIGMPFSLEGTAFFIEAIALGLFLYGRERLAPGLHLASGVVVGLAGVAAGVLVVSANGWMNSPTGFTYGPEGFSDIDPIAAMLNDAWAVEAVHMTLAAFASVGFAVAGVHAFRLLARPKHQLHRAGLRLALTVGVLAALVQPLSGDRSAKSVAQRQPMKLAAMESHFETGTEVGLWIGGIPNPETRTVKYGVRIPYLLSLLAFSDPAAEVKGLEEIPRGDWPPVVVCHLAFQVMVGIGTLMVGIGALFLWLRWRRPVLLDHPKFLWLIALSTPVGFIAVEAGWIVTEVGRQPWIIYGIMRTEEALTPMPGIQVSLAVTLIVYGLLSALIFGVFSRQIAHVEREEAEHG